MSRKRSGGVALVDPEKRLKARRGIKMVAFLSLDLKDVTVLHTRFFNLKTGLNLVSAILVEKIKKKKKKEKSMRILCLVVRSKRNQENEVLLVTVQYRKNSEHKIRQRDKLQNLMKIRGFETQPENETDFILYIAHRLPLHVRAESSRHRDSFLSRCLQVFKDYFINFPKIELLDSVAMMLAPKDFDGDGDMAENVMTDVLGEEEEGILAEVLGWYQMKIIDGKDSYSVLEDKLQENQDENIQNILSVEEQWSSVLHEIKHTKKCLSKMKDLLDEWCTNLHQVSEDSLKHIENENQLMTTQTRNLEDLDNYIKDLIKQLSIPRHYDRLFKKPDFDDEEVLEEVLIAVDKLMQQLELELDEGIEKMKSVKEQKLRILAYLKKVVQDCFIPWLSNKFSSLASQPSGRFDLPDNVPGPKQKRGDDPSKDFIPPYEKFQLKRYHPLMKCIPLFDTERRKGLNVLKQSYIKNVQPIYKSLFQKFTYHVKHGIKNHEGSRKIKMHLLGEANFDADSDESLVVEKGSHRRTKSSIAFNDDSDEEESSFGTPTTTKIYKVDYGVSIYLTTICEWIYQEYDFIQFFFGFQKDGEVRSEENSPDQENEEEIQLKKKKSSASLMGNNNDFVVGDSYEDYGSGRKKKISECAKFMEKFLWKVLTKDLTFLMNWIPRRCDLYYNLVIFNSFQEQFDLFLNHAFISRYLKFGIKLAQQKICGEFVRVQQASIERYRASLKRTTIVPFFANFPKFLEKLKQIDEESMKTKEGYEMLNTILKKMFDKLEVLRNTSEKHGSVFCLKNFSFFYRMMENEKNRWFLLDADADKKKKKKKKENEKEDRRKKKKKKKKKKRKKKKRKRKKRRRKGGDDEESDDGGRSETATDSEESEGGEEDTEEEEEEEEEENEEQKRREMIRQKIISSAKLNKPIDEEEKDPEIVHLRNPILRYVEIAKTRFRTERDKYMMKLLTYQPAFRKFFQFFRDIETMLKKMDVEDIALQPNFNRKMCLTNCEMFIKKRNAKKRYKALDYSLVRMNKHIGSGNIGRSKFKFEISSHFNLYRETWEYFLFFTLKQIKKIERIIQTCYAEKKILKTEDEISKNVRKDLNEITKNRKEMLFKTLE